ncbi:hypothetical protein PYW07_011401 [Mythimna separata]|uniref:Endonuclease/exonuclease/phosphatase domain-containing protein n=1 Tax=Mythimna separata TaxID=271217 RepID=A0AAD7Y9Q7_MYTSE|nr:hypothetical protein PYW07_011401 [Mythimna separata]
MPHLLFLTETQIRCPADAAYLNYPGYSLEHHFLQRAGVCVYVRNDICCQRLRHLEDPLLSTLWLLVDSGMDKIVYACVYRSHSGDQETTRLFDHLSEAADMALHRHPDAQFVALGDFNACHQDWFFPYQRTDHAGREARNFAVAMGLSQLVTQATRVPDVVGHTANCLDLLLTTDPDRCIVTVSSPIRTSDHCLVKSESTFSPPDCDYRGERRMWRYKSADWDEMRHFFASYPWQQVCFSSEDPSSCADAISDVVRQAMEYYIPYSDVPVGGSAHPWFNADCAEAEKRKHSAFLAWPDARDRKAPDLSSKMRAFNHAAKSYKKALRKARFDRITLIGKKLSAQPSGSRAFWSLAKSVEANFCRPTLPPLVKPDGTLAHTAREKAGLFASLFAHNSRLDTSSATPPILPHCDSSMSEVRLKNKEILRALCRLDVNKASGPDEVPQTILVNNMVVPAVREDQTEKDVDFTAEYHYVDGDIVNVTCVNLLNKHKAPLTMEYEMAGIKSDKSTVRDISSSTMIGFIAKLHAGHNNSYMICTNTGPKDYTKVMIRFVMLTKPNILSISINGMILRPIPDSFTNRHYEIKYKLVSHQPMHVTCEVERTDVKLLMLDDDFDKTVRRKTEYIIPNKKTELSFYLNQGDDKSLACLADYVMGGLAESVYIEFTTVIFPIDIYSQVHMELPPSGTVMELYSYKDYKLSVILYELKQNETLHLTCGPLPYYYGPLLYLQLNDTEIRLEVNSNVSVHVSWEHVYPEIVCFLKNATKTVLKDIRVIFLERALAVTEPSSTTLSTTTLTADIVTNNTTAEPPSSETSIDSNNNNSLAYFLIALGIAIVIIILVIIILVKKQCYVRLCLPKPAPRLDPASVFYVNLLSVCRPINEREAAALPENIYEEIPLGDLSNINSNRNKSDNQNDHLPNDDTHHYMEIDYAQCKPKGTEAPHKNNYIYDEPHPH